MTPRTLRLLVANIGALSCLSIAGFFGALTPFIVGPAAPGVWSIFGLTALGVWLVFQRRDHWAAWLAERMPVIGLVGTVLGLITALTGLSFDGDVMAVMASISGGMGLALSCTLFGLLGYLWLGLLLALSSGRDV